MHIAEVRRRKKISKQFISTKRAIHHPSVLTQHPLSAPLHLRHSQYALKHERFEVAPFAQALARCYGLASRKAQEQLRNIRGGSKRPEVETVEVKKIEPFPPRWTKTICLLLICIIMTILGALPHCAIPALPPTCQQPLWTTAPLRPALWNKPRIAHAW